MRGVAHAALDLATRLGYRQAGEEHLLVASIEAQLPADLMRALEARGITPERARSALMTVRTEHDSRDPKHRGTTSGATYHRALGRAQGLALAGGRAEPGAEDVMRGCLWEREGRAVDLLVNLGNDRDDVVNLVGPMPARAAASTLLVPAEREATALGDGFVGSWHVVLALLSGEPDAVASDALRVCGVTHDRYAEWLVAWLKSMEPPASRLVPGSPPTINPACRELLGRAEGWATARSVPSVRSADGVVAWLWEDYGQPVLTLEGFETTANALLDALAARGVQVPAVALPEPDRRSWGETVYFPVDRLNDVLARLNADLLAGDWGWNRCGERAWADAVVGIDLKAIVNEVLDVHGPLIGPPRS